MKVDREERAARHWDAVRAAILGQQVHDMTVAQVAEAAAHLVGLHNGKCKLKMFPEGLRLRCTHLDQFRIRAGRDNRDALHAMQDAIRALEVPAHLRDARLDIVITAPTSARERLAAESIVRRFTPRAVESWQ